MVSAFSSVAADAVAAPFVDDAPAPAAAAAPPLVAVFEELDVVASKAFASLSCRVTDPSVPTEALHINTRGALLRVVNGRCMLLGTCEIHKG